MSYKRVSNLAGDDEYEEESNTLDVSLHSPNDDGDTENAHAGVELTGSKIRSKSVGDRRKLVSNAEGLNNKVDVWGTIKHFWSTILFTWMIPLLELGNQKPLESDDLFDLRKEDTGQVIYRSFQKKWRNQLSRREQKGQAPSLTRAFISVFGYPFLVAGCLKLVHDSCLFVGPNILNKIILFLGDPSQPTSVGLQYVAILFFANLLMSLCLRQYFWWCYRVGMRLRSATITSVYAKSLVISAGVLSRKSIGEITNLMSIDSQRLQELTPYLHAIWYSFYQIGIALYFLWQQVGPACFGGIFVIVLAVPVTGKISGYLKGLQKALSKVRDERVKLSCEVLAGMKVIKFQAWESEFVNRVNEVRERELELFWKYSVAQALSGAVYTGVPILVGIFTFIIYIALGNRLHVSTALTSLALFEILRFPLYMLPNVLNNLVEAKVSVDRLESFLTEPEKIRVKEQPLKRPGVRMYKATLVYDGVGRRVARSGAKLDPLSRSNSCYKRLTLSACAVVDKIPVLRDLGCVKRNQLGYIPSVDTAKDNQMEYLSDSEYEAVLLRAQLDEANRVIDELNTDRSVLMAPMSAMESSANGFDESWSNGVKNPLVRSSDMHTIDLNNETTPGELLWDQSLSEKKPSTGERAMLALSRVDIYAKPYDLIAIVGQVGSGKSSLLQALLGELKLCSGDVSLKGRVAYVGQRPFIMNATLRDNVTFGLDFDLKRYERTLEMCALGPDLRVLPSGDMTEIGERGINLSGGQRARVALARAVYSDAEVYLLDDPLSAVDAHVGQHLFDECITVLRKEGKCVILVTNALHFLKNVSYIMVLKSSRIVESGTYDELMSLSSQKSCSKGVFAEMVATFQDTQEISGSESIAMSQSQEQTGTFAAADLGNVHIATSQNMKSDSGEPVKNGSENKQKVEASKSDGKSGRLIAAEDREIGDVNREVYMKWALAAGGVSLGILIVVMYIIAESISVAASMWLSYWSENRDKGSPWFYLGIYMLINAFVIAATLCKEFVVRVCGWRAAQSLFRELLEAVVYAPMGFFDTTPMGRITNRFSKDVYTVDEQLPSTMRSYFGTALRVISVILYIIFVVPLFLIGLGPIFGFYYFAQRYFIKTSRELTRLDSSSRSPIYALFSETLEGLSSIRAFKQEERLTNKCNLLLDTNQKAYFLNFSANCWLAVRLEFAGTLIVTFAALFAVLSRDGSATQSVHDREAFAGLAGLAVSLALSVTQSLNWSVRMASDLESQMVSVERIKSYATMQQEAAHFTNNDPTADWPQQGAIEMRNVCLRYRENMPLVLSGVNLSISPRHKVGIVGRTGAGKSSLLSALLRIVELEVGCVKIDGIDVSTIGLHALRSRIAVIPQDPVLFSGTVRTNLDPFGKYTDTQIWESLRRTKLSETIRALTDKVEDGGTNFSVGQRQLLCISRALLAQAKIIILDEATAAVDVETDAAIQKSLRIEFADATVLTVAHRLNTIMDSDRIVVMDQGRVAEFDTPSALLAQPNSMFKQLADNWEKANNQ